MQLAENNTINRLQLVAKIEEMGFFSPFSRNSELPRNYERIQGNFP